MKIRGTLLGVVACACALVLLGGAATLAQQQQQSEAQELTQKAFQQMQQGDFQGALKTLEEAIAEDENLALAWYYRGYAFGNLGNHTEARDAFVRATELAPQWGDAHKMATLAAGQAGDLETAWHHAIRAHQAGVDMTAELQQLRGASQAPGDLDRQLNAPRIFVADADLEGVKARNENPFGRAVDTGDGATSDVTSQTGDPQSRNTTTSRATGTGIQLIAETQGEIYNVLTKMRDGLADSRYFGLVPRQEMSTYTMVIEVDDIAPDRTRRRVEGYIKLYDTRSGEEAYSRVLELRNIASVADINADVERYIRYLEEWLEKSVG